MAITIEENERVCINCKYDGMDRDNPPEPCKECCNGWDGDKYTENHFEAEQDYILQFYAKCSNCKHQEDWNGVCKICERLPRDDYWEEAE